MATDPTLATGATPTPDHGDRKSWPGRQEATAAHPRPPWAGHQDGDGTQGKDRGDHMLMQTGELRVSDGPQYTFPHVKASWLDSD